MRPPGPTATPTTTKTKMAAPASALRIPVERSEPAAGLELRPRQVRRWIGSLPLEVTFESGRKLCRHLAGTNRARVDPGARQEILEAYRHHLARILADLEAMYARAPLPLGPGPRAALGLARELLTELALGYRIAIVESGARLFASRKQLGGLISRAVQCTAARMYAAYQSYTPVPAGTWGELHELYLEAEALGVARDPAEGEVAGSIADLYCEALLLSLTDPYRLAQGEAARVLQMLFGLRGLATLGRERPATPPGGHFVVPCQADQPPKPSISRLDGTGGGDWRLLDANPVVERLRAQAPAAGRGAAARAELVARLARLWGDPPKRTSRRDPAQATVAIAMGIEGVGHFVALERRVDLARQDDMLRRGITMPLAPLPLDDQSGPIPVFEWEVVNESRGGLRVRRLGRTEQPIAVGEAVGIKRAGKPHWAVGVTRWITVFEDGGMEFGLQYLAGVARAVVVSGWGVPPGPGLLIADEAGRARLLTSPNAFSHLRELELDEEGDTCLVVPGGVEEVTPRFEVFAVEVR